MEKKKEGKEKRSLANVYISPQKKNLVIFQGSLGTGATGVYLCTMPPFTFQFTLLQSYKALLVKLSPRGYLEEPGAMMHQAKSKIWTGVKPRRFMIGVDPKGAFIRIKDAVLRAQNEGRKRASEKIRKALPPELVQKVSPPREFGDMFGKNGVVRVRR